MLHAMSRRLIWVPFAVVALAPFAFACNGLKRDGADAAPVVVAPPATTATPPATPEAPPGVAPVAPLGAVAPGHPGGVKPAGDAGKAADGGPAADGGKTAPGTAPTPTLTIPTAIPGFDAGAFKPPPGFPSTFPSTLPTFPPPPK